jgi:hypothetical protein
VTSMCDIFGSSVLCSYNTITASYQQGIAVLAFEVGPGRLDLIFDRYAKLHPNLLPAEYKDGIMLYEHEARIFEVFAYYQGDKCVSSADEGTRLRFLESVSGSSCKCIIPGITPVDAEFVSCLPAYFDHWVSNGKSWANFSLH